MKMEKSKMLKVVYLVYLLTLDGMNCGIVRVTNNCRQTINVRHRRNDGGDSTSFQLSNGKSKDITFPNDRQGSRVWAHQSGDDSQSSTLAEMTFDPDGKLWYNISQVDGYTFSIRMEGIRNSGGRCEAVSCTFNINNCPSGGKISKGGKVIACKNQNRDSGNTDYVKQMKKACPNAYTWSKDDKAMRDCMPGNQGLKVRFC